MAENLNVLWIGLGILVVVLGPGGGVWAVVKGSAARIEAKFSTFVEQMRVDREETRDWLKELQVETSTNTTDIAVLEATTLKKKN